MMTTGTRHGLKRGLMLALLPVLLLLATWTGLSASVALAAQDIDPRQAVQLRLVDAGTHGDARLAALIIRLAPGWKTYWRVPGDGGLPPRFDFSGSGNVAKAQALLPAPRRFSDPLLGETIGYVDMVVMPILVRPRQADAPARLRLTFDYGICGKVCVPMRAVEEITLPPASAVAADAATRALALQWLARTPAADDGKVAVKKVRLLRDGDALLLEVRLSGPEAAQVTDVLVEGGPELAVFGRPRRLDAVPSEETGAAAAGGEAMFRIPVRGLAAEKDFAGRTLRLTILRGERAVERSARLP